MSKTRVLVVDDHPFFRTGVSRWLNQQPTLACCGEADSAAAARRAVAELRPDIILLDLRLGDGDGLDLTRELAEAYPDTRIIALSQQDEKVYAHRALRAGARGYVMKSAATETLLAAIQAVLGGQVYVSRPVAARLLHNLFPDPASTAPELALLSDRELQVFQLLGAGCGSRDIAEQLKISPKTVETYREHLKRKLGLPDGPALLRAAALWVEKGRLQIP
jgi:DNA-binding NarL/FixJ family response regulator